QQNSNNYHARENQVGVETEPLTLPQEFALYQNHPNPFNTTTTIQYQLPLTPNHSPLTLRLEIFDLVGRRVATLVDATRETGNRKQYIGSVIWEASEVSSGVYFYRLTAGNTSQVRRMTVLK
ncbi:MAG: T9SS type A sorting domain-containing protein, partial [Candidatus Zixiibacteriota bacterium]